MLHPTFLQLSANFLLTFLIAESPKRGEIIYDIARKIRSNSTLDEKYTVNPDEFLTMGRATPFEGAEVYGRCLATVYDGEIRYVDKKLI